MRTHADHNADKCGQTRTKTLNQSRGIPLGTRVTSLRALSVSFSVLSQKQEMRSGTHLLRPDRVPSSSALRVHLKLLIVRQGVSARAFLGVSPYVPHTREKILLRGSFLSLSNLLRVR